jgi:hypothetical protein
MRPALADAVRELLFSTHRRVEDVVKAFFADDYEHRVNGKSYSRDEFTMQACVARSDIAYGTITTHDELRYWDRFAERHVLDITRVDGSVESTEVCVIGRYAIDGRFLRLNEARFPLAGTTLARAGAETSQPFSSSPT